METAVGREEERMTPAKEEKGQAAAGKLEEEEGARDLTTGG